MAEDAKQQQVPWARTMPGVLVIGSAVVFVIALAALIGMRGVGIRSNKLIATSYFASAGGLKPGAAVNLDGVTIGTVKSISVSTSRQMAKTPVQVVMKLDDKYQQNLHTDSSATITSLGALGDSAVDIDSRDAVGPMLRDGDEMKAIANPRVLDAKAFQATANSVNALVGRANTLVDQLETGKGSIGQLLSNPGLTNEAQGTVSKVKQLTTKLSGNRSTVGRFMNDRSVTDKLASISKNMDGVNASITKLSNGPLQSSLAVTGQHVDSLTAEVNAGKGGVGMVMNDHAFAKQTSETTAQVNALVAGINSGKGSAGKLIAGGDVSVNLTKLQAEVSALTTKIRQNPTKYLTIQVRIF